MDLYKLYDIAEKEKINIVDTYLEDSNGMYVNYNKINIIALDYDNIETSIDEKCILAEELAHYYMDATYPASCTEKDKVLIEKQEYRACKWKYNILISYENLKLAIKTRNR